MIRREISRSGRNRKVLINGHPATNVMVVELGNLLVDIHGQHEHQSILNSDYHVEDLLIFMGSFCRCANKSARCFVNSKSRANFQQLHDQRANVMQHLDLLRFQQQEIKKARLRLAVLMNYPMNAKFLPEPEQLASAPI